MKWTFDMKWQLTANPKGAPISLSAPTSLKLPATTLSSKYAFVAIAPGVLAGPPATYIRDIKVKETWVNGKKQAW